MLSEKIMLGIFLIGLFIGIPSILVGITIASNKREEKQKKLREENVNRAMRQRIYNQILQSKYKDELANINGEVKELPQLTFDQWITFYNTSPERWDMKNFDTHLSISNKYDYLIPTYYREVTHKSKKGNELKRVTGIPIFWATPEDMNKFDNWYHNEYQNGAAAIYERKRDQVMGELANYLQEDVSERRRQLEEEYNRVVDDVRVALPNGRELRLSTPSRAEDLNLGDALLPTTIRID